MASPLDDAIAQQYGRWPYPNPAADLEAYARAGRDICDPALCHRLFWPDRDQPRDLDILVAGCGANQAADIAFHNRDARVLGLDVSEASLAHERYLRDKHALTNLELLRLPIEEVATLGRDFDLILATGVLHHMADPLAGMVALGGCLRRDGVLAAYLYGRHGRVGVEIVQSLFRRLGLRQDEASLALVKQTLAALPAHHPMTAALPKVADLNFESGLVDMFLNARERSYTVDECLAFVSAAGLAFQGWVENAHYHPEACLPPDGPLFKLIAALPEPEIWAATDLYVCNPGHFFMACRRDRPAAQYRIDSTGPQLQRSIPMRRPGVGVKQPDRATAQPARLVRDGMEVPLSDAQALLLSKVDGKRTVGEIIAAAPAAGLRADAEEIAAFGLTFFRSLWRMGLIFFKLAES